MKKKLNEILNWRHFYPGEHKDLLIQLGFNPNELVKYQEVLGAYKELFKEWIRMGEDAPSFINEYGYLLKPGGFVERDFFPEKAFLEKLAAEGKLKDQGLIDITRRESQHVREFYEELMTPENTGNIKKLGGEIKELGLNPFKKDLRVNWVDGKIVAEEIHHVNGIMELAPFFADLSAEDAFELRQIMFRDGYLLGSIKENRIALELLQHKNPYPPEILNYWKTVDPEGFKAGIYAGTGIHEIMGEHRLTTKKGGTLLSGKIKTLFKKSTIAERAEFLKGWLDYGEEAKMSSAMEAFADVHNLPGGKPSKRALEELSGFLGKPKKKLFPDADIDKATKWMKDHRYLDDAHARQIRHAANPVVEGLENTISQFNSGLDPLGGLKPAAVGPPQAVAMEAAQPRAVSRALGVAEDTLVNLNPQGAMRFKRQFSPGSSLLRRAGALMPVVGAGLDVWDMETRRHEMLHNPNEGTADWLDKLQYGLSVGTAATNWWAEPANFAMGMGNLAIDIGRTALEEDKRQQFGNTLRHVGSSLKNYNKLF